ncbi:uncharacterized protein LOC103524116 [Trichonephila clavipes]|uniref:Uncharacterized protein LOC103524116 n=1 Tax=Trichonephila clavipes TaxID=2585209 RepID=A0A8X6W394_TRICX|nr:uncharacterized protein LOC103524116 [Trichonephila clavipes]
MAAQTVWWIWPSACNRLGSGLNPEVHHEEACYVTPLEIKGKIVFQWVPSHCGLWGNERADLLAKKGTGILQNFRRDLTLHSAKLEIKRIFRESFRLTASRVARDKPWSTICKKSHGIPSSPRAAAVAKFRLLTGHDCLSAHLFRFNLVTSPICVLCDTGQDMTAAHLNECSALNDLNCIVKRYRCFGSHTSFFTGPSVTFRSVTLNSLTSPIISDWKELGFSPDTLCLSPNHHWFFHDKNMFGLRYSDNTPFHTCVAQPHVRENEWTAVENRCKPSIVRCEERVFWRIYSPLGVGEKIEATTNSSRNDFTAVSPQDVGEESIVPFERKKKPFWRLYSLVDIKNEKRINVPIVLTSLDDKASPVFGLKLGWRGQSHLSCRSALSQFVFHVLCCLLSASGNGHPWKGQPTGHDSPTLVTS